MPGKIPSDMALSTAETALKGLSLRQRTIANNVANVDTPGFRASEVSFEGELKRALGRKDPLAATLVRTNPNHLPTVQGAGFGQASPKVALQKAPSTRSDGNNVNIDQEMLKLVETNITYNALVQMVAKKFATLRSVIHEGKR